MRYGMSMLDNLHYIQNNGEKTFLANQNKIEASQPPPHPQEN